MGGKNKEAERSNERIANQQEQIYRDMLEFSKQRTTRMDELQAPAIDFSKAVVGGDRDATLKALSIPFGNLSRSTAAQKENIYDSVPAGAIRDFALSEVSRAAPAEAATLQNKAFMDALSFLSGAGSEQGNFGLQQLGAGMRSGEAAVGTNKTLIDAANQRKATQLGFLGSLAGIAGSAATGRLGGGLTSAQRSGLNTTMPSFLQGFGLAMK